MGNTQAKQSESRRDQEPCKSPEEVLAAKKVRAIEIIKKVIESGRIISKVTNEPLSRDEKTDYLARATFYFISEEREFHNAGANSTRLSPTYDSILFLASVDPNLGAIKVMVETIYEKSKKEEQYKQWMEEQTRLRMTRDNEVPPRGQNATNPSNEQKLIEMFLGHLQDKAWEYLIGGGATAISFGKSALTTGMEDVGFLTGIFQSHNGMARTRASAFVAGGYLAGVAGWNGYKVCKGQRSWRRAGKNVLSEVVAVGVGATTGIVVGTLLAPFTFGASLFFGTVSAVASSMITRSAMKKPTCWLFAVPESETFEKAHLTLEVGERDEMNDIGRAYRLKSREYHPDKFLSKNENPTEDEKIANLRKFLKVQVALRMIVAAREKNEVEYENAKEHFKKIEEEEELEKKSISIMLKIQILSFWNKIPFLNRSAATNSQGIRGGILPIKFFEETESPDKAARGRK